MVTVMTDPPPADQSPAPSPTDEQLLITYLQQHDTKCPGCKYNLRGIKAAQCPECGRDLALHITAAEPSQGPWLVMLVSLAVGSGLGVPSLFFICLGGLQSFDEGPLGALFGCSSLYFTACIPLMAAVLVNRSGFIRLETSNQQTLAGLTAFTTFVLIFIGVLGILASI